MQERMGRQTILITGATSGIGKAAAMKLAKCGARIILHGRNPLKLERVKKEISNTLRGSYIDTVVGDLFIASDIHHIAEMIKSKYATLDVLINNAGGMMPKNREETIGGTEKTVWLNLVAPFLLTTLLMDLLKKNNNNGRVITVSSSAHQIARPDFQDIDMKQNYSPLKAYANSKLYQLLMIERFAKELMIDGTENVTINAMNPGAVATDFLNKDFGPLLNTMGKLSRPFFKSAEKGADTLEYLATSVTVENQSGCYFENRKSIDIQRKYNTVEYQNIIWEYCKSNCEDIRRHNYAT